MPTLVTCLAKIKTGRATSTWTTIQADDKAEAENLLAMMYGAENVDRVREVETVQVPYPSLR